ncbi:ATP-binding cassette, subfamily B [Dethiosulfatibacter aminovorans DSM 17477]|uniref:ATP-binding cassette, subfamily B n=1 Tax=Dethiosulfatibacter aminovorans DSM 17477 TaxID=1121476 RepID=A0A1M6F3I9_9FIRM|nr:ABC transporter ATP-binding protein [Dethiosulfatibacter aminovorans]SHI92216.1 ATP-binding cassette, subfamily B [Dethiosulfatibacter aminovorans DSM 17477]
MIKLFKGMKKYKFQVVLVFVFTFMKVLAELMLPTLMADIVNIGIRNEDIAFIMKTGVVMLGIALAGTGSDILKAYLSARVSMSFVTDLRRKLFTKVQSLSPGEFDETGTSSLITRTTNDVTQIQNLSIMGLRMMIRAPLMAIGGVIMAVSKNPGLSTLILTVVLVLAALIGIVASITIPLFKKMQTKVDNLNRVLRERLTGIRVIRAFNRTAYERDRFTEANGDLTDNALKVNRIMASMFPMIILLMNFTTIAIVWRGAGSIDVGILEIGDMMAFIQYATMILFALVMMTMMFTMIPRASASAVRINEILDMETAITDPDDAKTPDEKRGLLEFRNVCFKYEGAEENALENISFKAMPGEVTGIIGSTGSGKSTLINMIPRFFDPCDGSIFVDGTDIREMTQRDLRNRIGLVPQKAVLFTGSVRDNIIFGDKTIDEDRLMVSAAVSQSEEFIDTLSDGYNFQISQGGTNLSGGQKQRLSIARALAGRKEIYIFDDSFSALDFKTDAALRRALKKDTEDSTVIIVTQRVNTIMDADNIIVLEKGRLAGMGKHRELMKDNQVYRDIVLSQMSEEESA